MIILRPFAILQPLRRIVGAVVAGGSTLTGLILRDASGNVIRDAGSNIVRPNNG